MRAERLHLTVGVMSLMDNEERLVASKLLGEAKDKIILNHNRDHVKLHVTLINSKYRKTSDDAGKKRETFDGSEILQRFKDFDFGVVELNQIHLSQRDSAGDDGYYQPTCVVSLVMQG
ncbi:Activating signal cointegrator 1 complex subunit 1 [Operophtera brumata]|uniref:Activating signal cointegrator 1 complex subunit 1 n=1 Tax=Operophtera brumata TaxID=104452 RepID=A0A0L7KSL8_OPEBR|nr:Activating signal cointegrator 1 complex subunit 1 [Operophtera brumata]